MDLRPLKRIARNVVTRIDHMMIRAASQWPFISNVYYCLNREFEREHHAVLMGRLRYSHSTTGIGGAPEDNFGHVYRLRRNTHRLEKGLIMRPRRPVFALDYLKETVDSFCCLYGQESASGRDDLYAWSEAVLGRYFEAVELGLEPLVDDCRDRYDATTAQQPAQDPNRAPFLRDTKPLRITIEDLTELAKRRRSVRWYDPRPVPREAIDRAVTVAGYSPSACNRQPFEFRIFDEPDLISQLAGVPMGTSGFSHQFPVFVVMVGKLHAYPFERDRHVIYIDTSLAAMALQFALEVQGIASCSINWPDVAALEKRMARLLKLNPDERVIMCLSAGYPDTTGLVPYSQKKPLDELRIYNRMGKE